VTCGRSSTIVQMNPDPQKLTARQLASPAIAIVVSDDYRSIGASPGINEADIWLASLR